MEKEIKEEELFIPKTKHKALKIILAIVLIGALIAGGYFLYKEKFCNPNRTVTTILENTQKEVNKTINETQKDKYKISGLIKVNANLSSDLKAVTDLINNIDLQFSGEVDTENKLGVITLNTKYKKEQLIDVKTYYESNKMYLLLEGLYDKYLQLPLDSIDSSTNVEIPKIELNENDAKTLSNSLVKAVKQALEKLEFKRISTTIKIDEKDQYVYNNYVELTSKEFKDLIKEIVSILSKDNEFTTILKKLSNDEVNFDDLIKNIDKLETAGTYRLNFFTNKNIFNQKLVSVRLEMTNDGATSTFNYDKVSDDEALITINASGATISSRVKKTNSVLNININANVLGMKLKMEVNANYEKIKEITKPDVSDSKSIDKLTDKESKEIEEKLQNNKGFMNFIQDVSKIKF